MATKTEASAPHVETIERARATLGMTLKEIAKAIHATESTLHRWRQGEGPEPTAVFAARLRALSDFLDELGRTFARREDAMAWLHSPLSMFQGQSPHELILQGHVDRLTGALYAMNAGIPD